MRFVLVCLTGAALYGGLSGSALAATSVGFSVSHQVIDGVPSYGLIPSLTTDTFALAELVSPNWDFYASTTGGSWTNSFATAGELASAMSGAWTLTDLSTSTSYTLNVNAASLSAALRTVSLTSGTNYRLSPAFAWSVSGGTSLSGALADVSFREVNDAVTVLDTVSFPQKNWSPAGGPFAEGLYEISISYTTPTDAITVSSLDLPGTLTSSLWISDGISQQVLVAVPEPVLMLPLVASTALLLRRRAAR